MKLVGILFLFAFWGTAQCLRDTCCCAQWDQSHWLNPREEKIYKFVDCPRPWAEAEKDCRRWGGHLVWITDFYENGWLGVNMMLRWGRRNGFPSWIGMNRRGSCYNNRCRCWDYDGAGGSSSTWSFWGGSAYQSSPSCGGGDCAYIINKPSHKFNAIWDNADCDTPMKYVCKKNPGGGKGGISVFDIGR